MTRILTEEQKERKRAYQREYQKDYRRLMSNEQKERYNSQRRERIKSMPTEQKELFLKKRQERNKLYYDNNTDHVLNIKRKSYHTRAKRTVNDITLSFRFILNSAKGRASKYNRDFNLNLDFLLELWNSQKGLCALSKLPMEFGMNTGWKKVSIDRIDSSKGYTTDNVQLVTTGANSIKLDMTQDDFIHLCKAIADNN